MGVGASLRSESSSSEKAGPAMCMVQEARVEDVTRFAELDLTAFPDYFVRLLDKFNGLLSIQAAKRIMLEELAIRKGQAVLDVGCGTGADVMALAALVGRRGQAVGVDLSETMLAEARRRASGSSLPVRFQVGDAQALPFSDHTFDACRAERMLMHVSDAEAALAELVRVTRPGGRVVVFDEEQTYLLDSAYPDVMAAIARRVSGRVHSRIGRQLPRLFREHGLVDVRVTPHTVLIDYDTFDLGVSGILATMRLEGQLSAGQVQAWSDDLRDRHEAGCFFVAQPTFIVAGTKP